MTDTLLITSSQAQINPHVTVFHLAGTLDAASEDALCDQAQQAMDIGAISILLDMQKLQFISSAGLLALHNIFNMCTPVEEIQAARGEGEPYKSPYFKIAAAPPQVYSVLNLAGFLHNIPFFPTMDDALKSYPAKK